MSHVNEDARTFSKLFHSYLANSPRRVRTSCSDSLSFVCVSSKSRFNAMVFFSSSL